MRVIDRYILRGFFWNYGVALTVMIGLYLVIDLFFNFDEFSKDIAANAWETARRIIDYYGYNMLLYFAQLAGVITVVAACCTLARMHMNNELTALLASGTSLYRVAWPLVLAGLLMNGLWVLDQEWLIPRCADKLARPHDDIEGRTVYPVWFMPDHDNALVSARRFLPSTGEIRDLIVLHRDADDRLTHITRADSARWDAARKAWLLTVGIEEFPGGEAGTPVPTDPGAVRRSISAYASDLTPADIVIQQASAWTNFLSLRQIGDMQRRFANDASFVKVKHTRLTTPFMNMIMLLIAIPFFLTRERRSIVLMGGRCLLVSGLCFFAAFIGQNVDFTGLTTNIALPIWAPVLMFGPVSVLLVDSIKT